MSKKWSKVVRKWDEVHGITTRLTERDWKGKQVIAMFMGEYDHSIDAKGRIIVPAKLREALGEEFIATKGLEGCLFLYPNSEWESFCATLQALPSNKQARTLQRHFMSKAMEIAIDKQGRILIPAKLREHAELTKNVVFVGNCNRVEVWDKDRWDEANDISIEEIDESMESLGISI